jgi:hypothetical protein
MGDSGSSRLTHLVSALNLKKMKRSRRNIKRSRHGIASTYNTSKYERNVVVIFDSLLELCVSNIVCKGYRTLLERGSFQMESAIVAVGISYECKGYRKHALTQKQAFPRAIMDRCMRLSEPPLGRPPMRHN